MNNRDRNFTKAKLARAMAESDERLARYLKQLDDADKDDAGAPGSDAVERLQEKIARRSGSGVNALRVMAKPWPKAARTRFR